MFRGDINCMLLLLLYCGFYLSGLLFARWMTQPGQALTIGLAITVSAGVAALTLWLLSQAGFTEPWLSIAMIGTIAVPALMIGLGLIAGWWIRHRGPSPLTIGAACLLPTWAVLIVVFG